MLEEAGLVRTEKNRGVFVREIAGRGSDGDLRPARRASTRLVGRQASRWPSRRDAQLEGLRAMVEAMARGGQGAERCARSTRQLNLQFYDRLVEHGREPQAHRRPTSKPDQGAVTYFECARNLADGGVACRSPPGEHRHIVKATIASGNPDAAGQAMFAHLMDGKALAHANKAFGRADAAPAADVATPNNPHQKEV